MRSMFDTHYVLCECVYGVCVLSHVSYMCVVQVSVRNRTPLATFRWCGNRARSFSISTHLQSKPITNSVLCSFFSTIFFLVYSSVPKCFVSFFSSSFCCFVSQFVCRCTQYSQHSRHSVETFDQRKKSESWIHQKIHSQTAKYTLRLFSLNGTYATAVYLRHVSTLFWYEFLIHI